MVTTHKASLDFKHLIFPIKGMSCASCASRIEKKVTDLDGIKQAGVNFGAEQALIEYDPDKVSPVEVREVM